MKKYEDYYNDPDIIDEPAALREVHAIRLKIQDETKGLTPKERADRTNGKAREILERHGIRPTFIAAKNPMSGIVKNA
jgi:hypothetical protein